MHDIIMKTRAIVLSYCLLLLGYTLLQISFLESSSVMAFMAQTSPTGIQGRNVTSAIPNINTPSTGNSSARPTMLPYANALNGISMLYPSDWQPSTSGLAFPQLIRFYSPLQNLSDFIPAQVTVGVTKYANNGITLPQYTSFILTLLNQSKDQKQLTIDNSNPVTVAGNPGYRVTFTSSASSNSTSELRTMQLWTVVDNKLYTISYVAEPSKFITYLPKVTQMLGSLKIIRAAS